MPPTDFAEGREVAEPPVDRRRPWQEHYEAKRPFANRSYVKHNGSRVYESWFHNGFMWFNCTESDRRQP